MGNIGWIIVFVGAGILFGIVGVWRMLRGKETEYKLQEKRNSSQGLMTLASSFLVLGIALGTATDRLVGYLFIGTAVFLSIVGAIKSRKREQGSSVERLGELLKKNVAIDNWQNASFVLGVLLCLVGALLMFEGSILGERTTGVATVIGIVGIGLIAQRSRS